MKLYLSRRRNGLYQLTGLEPIRTGVLGTGHDDIYPRPGDPVVFQGMCPFSVHKLFGRELGSLEILRVRLVSEVLS